MKKDEKVHTLDLGDEFLLDSAEKRFQSGDYLGALTMLNKRNQRFNPSADAHALAADVYEAMELYNLAADSWFRFLDTCNELDFPEGYEGLAVSFMNMGNEVQAALCYRHVVESEGAENYVPPEELDFSHMTERAKLRIVHSEDGDEDVVEYMARGLFLLKAGDLKGAQEVLAEIPEKNTDYPSARGLYAMCALMLGDEEKAEEECARLLEKYPENIQALTTYCAVLGAREQREKAREVARKLSTVPATGIDDKYRVATALCETGLDEEAYFALTELREKLPYDDNVLWFLSVAACHTDRLEVAIDALEILTTIFPRKAVALYYLERLRRARDGEEEKPPMTYFYRVPEAEYRTVADFLLKASGADPDEALTLGELKELHEFFRIAFDEMEGRDEKLQMLASKVAAKCRADEFLRDVLLNYEGDDIVKLSILHELTMRNEDNSFGTVICNVYREFFIHHLDIGVRKSVPFLRAFADVYAKYAILGEAHENKLCSAAEDIYRTLEDAEAWDLMDERTALAAAIYREARLVDSEHEIEEVCKLFDADRFAVQKILNFMM